MVRLLEQLWTGHLDGDGERLAVRPLMCGAVVQAVQIVFRRADGAFVGFHLSRKDLGRRKTRKNGPFGTVGNCTKIA